MPETPGRDGDATPFDHDATQRLETGAGSAAPDPQAPHPGWSRQPRAAYEAGDSGGWGGPSPHHTGPLPRLRRPGAGDPQPGRTPDEQVTFAPAQGYDLPEHDEPGHDAGEPGRYGHATHATHVEHGGHEDAHAGYGHDPYRPHEGPGGHPEPGAWSPGGGGPRRSGSAAGEPGAALGPLFDLSFRRRATSSIVPFTYTVLLVFLLLDYMRSIYEYSSSAAGLGAGAVGGLLIVFVVGLFKLVVVAAVARLALELCVNVAEVAGARRGERG